MIRLMMDGVYFMSIDNCNIDGRKMDRARVTDDVDEAHIFEDSTEVQQTIGELNKIYKNVKYEVIEE